MKVVRPEDLPGMIHFQVIEQKHYVPFFRSAQRTFVASFVLNGMEEQMF